jgi:hypothetical protein
VHPRTGDLEPGHVVWAPPADARQRVLLGRYLDWLAAEDGHDFAGYHDLHRWSVTDLESREHAPAGTPRHAQSLVR